MIKYLIAFLLIASPCLAGMGIGGFPQPGPGVVVGTSGPVEVASDDFSSYSHATNLGGTANWTVDLGAFITLSSAHVRPNASGFSSGRWTADSFSADQYSEVTIQAVSAANRMGPAVRVTLTGSSKPQFYGAGTNGTTIYLYSYNGDDTGSELNEISNYPVALASGNKLKIEATGTGSAIRLAVYYDTGNGWTPAATNIDPVDEFDSGSAGINGTTNATATYITAWAGGNL